MRGDGHAVWSLGLRDKVSKFIRPLRLGTFPFQVLRILGRGGQLDWLWDR